MARGGYQQPSAPAPASGPGRLSRRTDGGPVQKLRDLPDAAYGEAQTFRDLQQSAPLAQSPSVPVPPTPGTGAGGGSPLTGFGDPTTNPDEPVTAGAAFGPGPGMEALGLPDSNDTTPDYTALAGYLPALEVMASMPSASDSFRNFVRQIRGGVR